MSNCVYIHPYNIRDYINIQSHDHDVLRKDIRIWCGKNLAREPRINTTAFNAAHFPGEVVLSYMYVFSFYTDEDAMMFKMKWS